MDLLSIVGTIWRHKLATIPVILLTALGVFYVLAIKPPVYKASSSVLLVYPPDPPTAAQIAADPKLAKINTNNPYTGLGSLSAVGDVVISVVTADSAQLAQAGANDGYQVTLSTDLAGPPIIEIIGDGSSMQAAIRAANLVTGATKSDLYNLQKGQRVNKEYMIKAIELDTPNKAQLQASGKLRTLVAVLALGVILLFVVVSVTEAMEKRRMDSSINGDMPARGQPGQRELEDVGGKGGGLER
jgi:hypothetical protein